MHFSTAILLLPISVSLAAVIGLEERNACTDVHLFLARGNGEEYPGRVGAISDTVCSGLPSCDYENIMFVSTQDYCDQAADGASAGISQIAAYSNRCPKSKLVVAGYSLGAQIVGDILGGGGGSFYNCVERGNGGLGAGSSQIAAVLLFGDVRHVANQGYNVGPGSGSNGQYPRSGSQLSTLNNFAGKIRSYCLATDPICALGDDGESHTTYMQVYAAAAGEWVQESLGFKSASSSPIAAVTTTTSTSTSAGPSSTAEGSTTSDSSAAASSSTSFAPPSDASTTSSPSSTTYSSAAESSAAASSSTTSTPANTSTFVPFVFESTSSGASTTTFAPVSTTAALPFSVTAESTSTVVSHVITSSSSSSASSRATSTATPTPITSKAGAGSNAVQLSMTLITLVVVKVLAF